MEKTYLNNVSNYIDEFGHMPPVFIGMYVMHLCLEVDETGYWEKFIKSGFDVDEIDQLGQTVLMKAVAAEDLGAIKKLIELGADVNKIDYKGGNCISYLKLNPNEEKRAKTHEIMKLLYDKGANFNLLDKNRDDGLEDKDSHILIKALRYDYLDSNIIAIIELGERVDISVTIESGDNLLMTAFFLGKQRVVKTLLDKGIDINYESNRAGNIFSLIKTQADNVPNGQAMAKLILEYQAKKEKEQLGREIKIKGDDGIGPDSAEKFKI